jgi:hypothetical protein
MTLQKTSDARKRIPNKNQWSNLEAVFCARSLWQLRDATVELLEAMFYMWSALRLYHSTDRMHIISFKSLELGGGEAYHGSSD